jgi:recombination DNA repair RAD52 pathway protein
MLYQDLSAPFPPEMERELRKGGTSLTYIPVSEVITRLNKVLGVEAWSMRIISCERDRTDSDFIVAHVTLDAVLVNDKGDRIMVHRDGIGGQKIKRTKQGEIVDLGDEMKGAVSDALKKAAQTLGIGLYLSRSEEAMDIEAHIDASVETQTAQAPTAEWDAFVSITKTLTKEQKESLRERWAEHSNGAPIPKQSTASLEDIEFLHAHAVALSLNATLVNE